VATRLFVDTLFIVASINPRDQHHQRARALALSLKHRPVLTTDAVLLEVGNTLTRSHRVEAARTIENLLQSEEAEVVRLSPDLFERGLALYKQHRDKAWGLVDCVSFVVMRQAGVTEALTFDHHFAQAGFRPLMTDDPTD
jgi:uncharacterized protein